MDYAAVNELLESIIDTFLENKAKLGSGARFKALKNKLAHRKGVRNPGALAAYIGDKKYGVKKMSKMAHHNK